jgi:carboxypeptidase family protein
MDSLRVPGEYLFQVNRLGRILHSLLIVGVVAALPEAASAQGAADEAGAIEGVVSTQHGTVRLPGAVVSIDNASDQEVSQQVSDDQGHFRVGDLPPARYRVHAFLDGFQVIDVTVIVESGQTDEVALDLPIATVTENVTVVASPVLSEAGSLTAVETVNNKEAELLVPGEGVQSTLRLLSSVIQLPRGASIDGGSPNQVGFQINTSSMVDPVTGLTRLSLPPEAIESVSVLPNPYEAEFGRFSSGVVVVQTRRAPDQWRTQVENIEPGFRLKRYTLFNITGIGSLKPGFVTGGPIGDGSVWLEQSAQYRYDTTDIPSRPEDQLKTAQSLSTFTRVDAKLSPRHSLIVTGGVFPSSVDQATLGTFTPPAATADTSSQAVHGMLTERVILSTRTFLESTVQVQARTSMCTVRGPRRWNCCRRPPSATFSICSSATR